jgi:hypothetical protein
MVRAVAKVSFLVVALCVAGQISFAAEDPFEPAPEGVELPKGQEPAALSRFGEKPADEAYGAFQRGYYITARNLALPRAEKGDPAAQTLIAEIYARGLGIARDPELAGEWYEKAAAQGVPEAQFRYALILLERGDADSVPHEEAIRLMKAAADAGNAMAQFNYAQLIIEQSPGFKGQVDAFKYYRRAAERNVPDAQYAVAQYYTAGTGDIEVDLTEARKWLARAAVHNYDSAQLELGNMLLSGIGGERDLEAGFGWIKRAAVAGNVASQVALAKLYWGGIGVEADSTEAAAWYVLARRAGMRDRVLDDFWEGISGEVQQASIERANRLR